MQPVRLVLVEDMPMEAEIAVRQLESGGFSCNWKRVDSEAVLRRALVELKPDLILSDFTLPGFDGLQRGAYDYVLKTNMARLVPAVRRALDDATIRRTQRALEQQLRDIVVTSQDWIWEHDRDGKFTF